MTREELFKNAKPILFNTEMVRAILEDRKTVTRRVIKVDSKLKNVYHFKDKKSIAFGSDFIGNVILDYKEVKFPYQVGDILYVRETWQKLDNSVYVDLSDNTYVYVYKASEDGETWQRERDDWTWHPSIHMPKEAARIFLKVKNVRIERLQDITSKEAIKEGLKDKYAYGEYNSMEPKKLFIDLWNSTIKKQDLDKYGWEANPYVWVIEFERVNYDR